MRPLEVNFGIRGLSPTGSILGWCIRLAGDGMPMQTRSGQVRSGQTNPQPRLLLSSRLNSTRPRATSSSLRQQRAWGLPAMSVSPRWVPGSCGNPRRGGRRLHGTAGRRRRCQLTRTTGCPFKLEMSDSTMMKLSGVSVTVTVEPGNMVSQLTMRALALLRGPTQDQRVQRVL